MSHRVQRARRVSHWHGANKTVSLISNRRRSCAGVRPCDVATRALDAAETRHVHRKQNRRATRCLSTRSISVTML